MGSEPKVQIVVEEGTKVSNPRIVIGIPEAGLVGVIAGSYMIQQLKLQEIGHVESELLPEVVVVHNSEPKSPIRIFGGGSLILLVSEIPLDPGFSYELAETLEGWAMSKNAELVVGITGLPSKNRMNFDQNQKPILFGVSNDKKLRESLPSFGVQPFQEGVVTGIHATLLKEGALMNVPNLILLVESYLEFPDPAAAATSVEALGRLLSIQIDTKSLVEESEGIRLKLRGLMRNTQESIAKTAEAPSVYA